MPPLSPCQTPDTGLAYGIAPPPSLSHHLRDPIGGARGVHWRLIGRHEGYPASVFSGTAGSRVPSARRRWSDVPKLLIPPLTENCDNNRQPGSAPPRNQRRPVEGVSCAGIQPRRRASEKCGNNPRPGHGPAHPSTLSHLHSANKCGNNPRRRLDGPPITASITAEPLDNRESRVTLSPLPEPPAVTSHH
jgi:hypothetical protein